MNLNRLLNTDLDDLQKYARQIQRENFGNHIYVRGLIELTNYCKNNCYYCGIRSGNRELQRYRMNEDEVLTSCDLGYSKGYRTFVIQGGEDPYYNRLRVEKLVKRIKAKYPDCAITLSLGEQEKATYQTWFDAGADRYLLRHEAASNELYKELHPEDLLLENRLDCLRNLKEIGYQTGTGFMVGSPGQTHEHLLRDLEFIEDFQPHMVGIGPFVPHENSRYADYPHGDTDLTLKLISILRIMLPKAMLPSTTALATIDPHGREKGILAGANVLMPNISPWEARERYDLYDNKSREDENIYEQMDSIGYKIIESRGDFKNV